MHGRSAQNCRTFSPLMPSIWGCDCCWGRVWSLEVELVLWLGLVLELGLGLELELRLRLGRVRAGVGTGALKI